MVRKDNANKLIVSENDLLTSIVELAGYTGWYLHHDRPALLKDGSYRTAVQGNAGFPDIVLAKDGRILFRELKSDEGTTTTEQDAWLAATGGSVWRPSDWPEIERELTSW